MSISPTFLSEFIVDCAVNGASTQFQFDRIANEKDVSRQTKLILNKEKLTELNTAISQRYDTLYDKMDTQNRIPAETRALCRKKLYEEFAYIDQL